MNPRRLIKKVIPKSLFRTVAPYGHLVEAIIYNCIYGFPARGMKVIGITGTNGKTSTSFIVHRMLVDAGYNTGLMTTAKWGIGNDTHDQKEHMTNMPIPVFMKRLKQMRAAGVEWVVLETTSHALVQYRTWGVRYSVGVLTNITHEHLDYHKTFERYVAAKQLLFKRVQRNRRGLQMGIANADDQNGASFAAITQNSILYGIEAGDVRATNIKLDDTGITYDAQAHDETYHIHSSMPGNLYVYNTLAALSVGMAIGLDKDQIERGIAALKDVDGRMQRIDAGQDFMVIVDYAYTPDALEKVLEALRKPTKGKLAVVFGATGDRDKTKRGPMGEVATRMADKIYLTDDETYTEDPDAIRDAVYKGIKAAGGEGKTQVVPDRLDAIKLAFKQAKAGDTVLLAGIGHQDYRDMGGQKMPWDEREVARQVLEELK